MVAIKNDRRGIALAAAVLALVIIGALVTGGFYAASQESRSSMSNRYASRAASFAEQGLQRALAGVTRQMLGDVANQETRFVNFQAANHVELIASGGSWPEHSDTVEVNGRPVGAFHVTIRRLGDEAKDRLFWIRSRGEVLEGGRYSGATRTIGATVRLVSISFPLDGAFQLRGSLNVKGNSTIDGLDNPPDNWGDCPPAMDDQPGILAEDSTQVDISGNASEVTGDPPVDQDSTISDSDFSDFGDVSFDELAASASKRYEPAASPDPGPAYFADDTCNFGEKDNWGEPTDPSSSCHFYFPTIYAEGDMNIAGSGVGQGILLVRGNLKVTGGFEFFGVVIVKGVFETAGTGGHINGIVMAQGGVLDTDSTAASDESEATGNSIINFSSCAVKRAQKYSGPGRFTAPLDRRFWIDLSAAGA